MADAQRALRLIRSKALEWNLNPSKLGIMGFSAGGHLASTVGTHYDKGDSTANGARFIVYSYYYIFLHAALRGCIFCSLHSNVADSPASLPAFISYQ